MPEPRDHLPSSTKTQSDGADALASAVGGDTVSSPEIPDSPTLRPSEHRGEVGRLGRYRVLQRLGAGGMGAVYLAFDEGLRRRAALKVMLPKFAAVPAARERFLREARTCAGVKSEHVVTIYDVGEEGGAPFIAMEYLQGYPLDEYLKRHDNRLSIPQVLRVGREVAQGLSAAHALGLVHRDIKPANLWLEAPRGRVKILDFGLAKGVTPDATEEGHLTNTGAVVGTPAYMSPEQARGQQVDAKTDLFSLGGVLYRLTTGRLPFTGPTTMAILTSLGMDDPTPVRELNPAVPNALADLIHRLLAKQPAQRPASAADVARELLRIERALVSGELSSADPVPMATAVGDLPQVVYVPIPVAAHEPSAFAGLDEPSSVIDNPDGAAPAKPKRERPKRGGGRVVWAAVAASVLLAGALGAVLWWKFTAPKPVPPQPDPPEVVVKPTPDPRTIPNPTPPDKEPPPVTAAPIVIDLLPLIDPVANTVGKGGEWKKGPNGSLIAHTGTGLARLEIPYEPLPDEYDFEAEFTRINTSSEVALMVSRGGRQVKVAFGAGEKPTDTFRAWGFGDVGSERVPFAVPFPGIKIGRRYKVRVEVRRDRIAAYQDDVLLGELKTDWSDPSVPAKKPFPNRERLDLVTNIGGGKPEQGFQTRFHALKLIVPATVPPGPWESLFNGKDLTGWDGDPKVWKGVGGEIVGTRGSAAGDLELRFGRLVGDFDLSFEARAQPDKDGRAFLHFRRRGGAGKASVALPVSDRSGVLFDTSPYPWRGLDRPQAAVPGGPDKDGYTAFRVRAVGGRVAVAIDGRPTTGGDYDLLADGALAWVMAPGCSELRVRNIESRGLSQPADPDRKADRAAAEWVLSKKGEVRIDGAMTWKKAGDVLPAEPFKLTGVTLKDPGYGTTDDDLARFAGCPDIRHFQFWHAKITDKGVKTLAEFAYADRVRVLVVQSADKVSDAGMPHVARFTGLTTLDVSSPRITDAGVVHLYGLTGLTRLDLNGKMVTEGRKKELAGALPACKIVWQNPVAEPPKK